jgi:hypothetical protein
MSITGAKADRWVPIRPGAEGLVAQAIIKIIADEKLGPAERVERAAALAGEVNLEDAAAACEMSVEDLVALARVFAVADRPVAIPGDALTGARRRARPRCRRSMWWRAPLASLAGCLSRPKFPILRLRSRLRCSTSGA